MTIIPMMEMDAVQPVISNKDGLVWVVALLRQVSALMLLLQALRLLREDMLSFKDRFYKVFL